MLAGLLFATHEAEDRPGTLAATLPFAAGTLIEYQARLLLAAGAAQIVVVVARLTPELLGALARVGRRGVAVDTARTAAEAAAKLHPLARVVMLADGLVASDAMVRALAGEGGDALLVLPADRADACCERIGGGQAWAGVARIDARRVAEAAKLPEDYDLQSSLLRGAGQAGARHVPLPDDEIARGHGIERRAGALEARGRAVLAASMASRPSWFDRTVLRPLARLLIPEIARRGVATGAVVGLGTGLGLAGVGAAMVGAIAIGALAMLAGVLVLELGGALAWFRDEPTLVRAARWVVPALPALAALVLGWQVDAQAATATGRLLAVTGIAAAALGERAASATPRRGWWASAPAQAALLAAGAAVGQPLAALAAATLYAAATLAAAVEALRRDA
jgi:hypothetical protein